MGTKFGEYFAELRRNHLGVSLREFCARNGLDPGNISKLERGKLPPPQSHERLEKYARALELTPGSEEWLQLFDLAAASRGEIPAEIMEDEELVTHLPVLFRTLRGDRVPDEKLKRLLDIIRNS